MATPIERLVVIERIIEKIPNRYEAVRVMAREARRLNSLVIRGAEADDAVRVTGCGATSASRRGPHTWRCTGAATPRPT